MKKGSFLFGAYGMLWQAATPLLRRHHRLREGFEERLVPAWWPYGHSFPTHNTFCDARLKTTESNGRVARRIWIQAASGGEALLVEALVAALQEQWEEKCFDNSFTYTLLCTTCTRQGLDVLERLAEQVSHSPCVSLVPAYLPLDIPKVMETALQQAQAELVVLLETELWPGLLRAAKNAHVPVAVLNGRMTEKSASGYRFVRGLLQKVAPTRILATSEDSAARFAALFDEQCVATMPNIKFDLAFSHLCEDSFSFEPIKGMNAQTPLAIFASTRQEEEVPLLEAIQILLKNTVHGIPVKIIVAPRHLHRVSAWSTQLKKKGIPFDLWSSFDAGCTEKSLPQVLIWDCFGDLPQLYSMADAVFIGGSLAPLGGQNFLESLAQGCVTFMGPSRYNFAWVGDDILHRGLLVEIETAAQLATGMLAHMQAFLSSMPEEWPACRAALAFRVRQDFKEWITPYRGGAKKAALVIEQLMAESSEPV